MKDKSEKLCKDCKWCKEPGEFAKCRAPQNERKGTASKRTGFEKKEYVYDYCHIQRDSLLGGWIKCRLKGSCGKEGRWWEKK